MARYIFYRGSLFFILTFVGLTARSRRYVRTTSTDAAGMTESVAASKHVWESQSRINCHTHPRQRARPSAEASGSRSRSTLSCC